MSKFQRGKSGGVSGIVSLDNGAVFPVKISRWKSSVEGQPRERRGPGGGFFGSVRFVFGTGNILLTGIVPPTSEASAPGTWAQVNGVVKVAWLAGKSISYPITVLSHGYDFLDRKQELPAVICAARITGSPTYNGWSTLPTNPSLTKSNQKLYDGTTKTIDPNSLQPAATRRTDIWGDFADSDNGNQQLLANVIAAAQPPLVGIGTPPITLKLRTATYLPDAVDGGTVNEVWGATSTLDDLLNPHNLTTTDPDNIDNSAERAGVNAEPAFSGTTNTIRASLTKQKINDAVTLYVASDKKWTPKQQIELGESFLTTDVSGINSTGQTVTVFNGISEPTDSPGGILDPTVPTGLQIVDRTPQNLNAFQYKMVVRFAENTSKQAIEFPGTFTNTDVSDLRSHGQETEVFDTGASTPAAHVPAGLQQINSQIIQINPNKKRVEYFYAKDTPAQEVAQQVTNQYVDPNSLTSESEVGLLDSEPGVAGGLVDRGYTLKPVTHDHNLYTRKGGVRTTIQDVTFPETKSIVDPSDLLNAKASTAQTFASNASTPTPAATDTTTNTKLVNTSVEPLTSLGNGISKFVANYGKRNGKDEQELEVAFRTLKTHQYLDANGLKSTAVVNNVDNATPTVPAGFKQIAKYVIPLTQGLSPDHVDYVLECGLTDTLDELQMPGTIAMADITGDRSISGTLTEQTQILTCIAGDTPDTLLASAITTLKAGTKPYESAVIHKINDLKYRQVTKYFTDDKKFTVRSRGGGYEEKMVTPDGLVLISEVQQYSSTFFKIKLEPWTMFVTRETVVLRRYIKATTFNESGTGANFDSYRGTRNTNAFGDFAATTMVFLSAEIAYSFAESGSRWLAIDFVFERVIGPWNGAIVDMNYAVQGIPRDWYVVTGITIGSLAPTGSLINAGWVPGFLPTKDYSPFLT